MKKIILLAGLFLATMGTNAQTSTTEEGVVINGVKWATRNVDAAGTFAETPESAGKFYQWNRKTDWNATGDVTGWDKTTPGGTEWAEANDPSPEGWCVPTREEIISLLDEERVRSEWTTQNGVNGRKFIDKETGNSIFLPAAGYRVRDKGTLNSPGSYGNYWSSAPIGIKERYLGFDSGVAAVGNYGSAYGRNIRPVEK
ncbi:MAG: fibrobacter succinogenes major paralogous domain-containing protein [Prevotellaceae bacterium]|jgi:hypothetical protein|nr:fibrobacter succinogenes major paralogous domain-containing protein [Prevotellaceae bacterium]